MAKSKNVSTIKNTKITAGTKKQLLKETNLTQKSKGTKLKKLAANHSPKQQIISNTTGDLEKPFNFVRAPKRLVAEDQVQKGTSALFQYVEKNTNNTETLLFNDEKPIFLQITSIKVPKTPARVIRLNIPHTLLTDSSEICLIVKDLGKPKEHDETIEHYEQLLSRHEITNIKTILPFHQFKTEYGNQFELKRNLLGLYDCFLVDSRIAGYVTKLLGKVFMEKRKIPASIKIDVPHLKSHLERTIQKTALKVHSNSDCFIIQVAHTKMEQTAVSENIVEVIDQLCHEFPGGSDNIRALSIKTDKSIAIPIYLTLRSRNEVPVPVILSKRPKHFNDVTGELTTYLNREVTVLPSGKVMVHTIDCSDDDEEEEEDIDLET